MHAYRAVESAHTPMDSFEVTQALMAVGSVYHVRRPRSDATLYTVSGELMSTAPKFRLTAPEGVEPLADLSANFIKTKYEIRKHDALLATLVFPAVAFKKKLVLRVGADEYEADGGIFKGVFQCKNAEGVSVLEIAKELSFRDSFLVKTSGVLALEVALLSAVAIHSRFYEMV